jgi:hypothetical protein
MASPQQPDDPSSGDTVISSAPAPAPRPVLKLRLVPWDITCAVVLLVALVAAAFGTDWGSRLFGFLKDVCMGDDCPPVPFGIDFYIYPVVWGGIGAAAAAAVVGPVVSLLKGWYLYFWPLVAMACIAVSAIGGYVLTTVSTQNWQ